MRVAIRSANDVYSVSWRGWRMGRALVKLKFKIEIPQKKSITPQKTNMEPENGGSLEKEMPSFEKS